MVCLIYPKVSINFIHSKKLLCQEGIHIRRRIHIDTPSSKAKVGEKKNLELEVKKEFLNINP